MLCFKDFYWKGWFWCFLLQRILANSRCWPQKNMKHYSASREETSQSREESTEENQHHPGELKGHKTTLGTIPGYLEYFPSHWPLKSSLVSRVYTGQHWLTPHPLVSSCHEQNNTEAPKGKRTLTLRHKCSHVSQFKLIRSFTHYSVTVDLKSIHTERLG